MSADLDAGERERLEAEREFLIRSLDDLDNERAAGNIDDDTYDTLHGDYTARAAAVLRQLRDGVDLQTPEPKRPASTARTRQLMVLGAIAVFALLAVILLVQLMRDRSPGGSVTGNNPTQSTVSAKVREQALLKQVQENPRDYAARIALARFYLNEDLTKAIKQYDIAAQLDKKQPEPLAYGGWIRAIAAGNGEIDKKTQSLLVTTAMDRFSQAIKIAPTYPDTFVFRGILRYRVLGDLRDAKSDFQRYLELAPQDGQFRSLVLDTLANVQAQLTPGSTTVPPTTG
jgi:tetratricopeptide (TPR) repeat protein